MKILLSPSKTQNFSEKSPTEKGEQLVFKKETNSLSKILKEKKAKEFGELMHISPKLSELTYERFQKWSQSFNVQKWDKSGELNFKQALFAFSGDVYRVFEHEVYSKSDINYMEKSIRIISGFYGLLSPLTYIKPYRLEMGTKLQFKIGKREHINLYEYWRDVLTERLVEELKKDELVINLASVEYSKAINLKVFGDRLVQIDFKVMKNGEPKTIGIYAKRQRGEMANWIIKKRIEKISDLKKYKNGGFSYAKELSKDNHLVFLVK